MQKVLIYLLLVISISCQRLDDFLYAPTKTNFYKLNDIDSKYLVIEKSLLPDQDKIHELVVDVLGDDGELKKIYGYYIGDLNSIDKDTVIVYCHGNSGNIDHYWQRAVILSNVFSKNQLGVLIFDYQGYGKSEGKPFEEGLYRDTEAFVSWLKSKGLTGDRLILYGFSMGTAPATRSCSQPGSLSPEKLILEAPYASAARLANTATPLGIPGSYVTDLYIDNAEEITKVNQPLLWFHGTDDVFLTLEENGQLVFDRHQGKFKSKKIVDKAGHGNVVETLGVTEYLHLVETYLMQ